MGRALLLATALALASAAPAAAQTTQPLGPWDGTNPFRCVNQDVGKGTDFPDPKADPFCVEFDKTSQNITDFGIVDFAAQEPTRVAAAGDKCFYFQRDHWTGSIVQGSEPELWHWDGSYFFDRAKGVGGVHVTNFRIGGVPADATPYVPAAYQPYVSPTGGGGVRVLLESNPDPICKAKIEAAGGRDAIYRGPEARDCIQPGGRIHGSRVGGAALGTSPAETRRRLGSPHKRKHGSWRWCVVGGSSLRVAFAGKGKRRHVAVIRTDAIGQHVRGIGPGVRKRRAVRKLALGGPRLRVHGAKALLAPPGKRSQLVVGMRGRHVAWLALAERKLGADRAALRRALRRLG